MAISAAAAERAATAAERCIIRVTLGPKAGVAASIIGTVASHRRFTCEASDCHCENARRRRRSGWQTRRATANYFRATSRLHTRIGSQVERDPEHRAGGATPVWVLGTVLPAASLNNQD